MTDPLVRYEKQDAVSTITLDDGKVNALSPAMFGALNAALDRAESDGSVVLITGRAGRSPAASIWACSARGGRRRWRCCSRERGRRDACSRFRRPW